MEVTLVQLVANTKKSRTGEIVQRAAVLQAQSGNILLTPYGSKTIVPVPLDEGPNSLVKIQAETSRPLYIVTLAGHNGWELEKTRIFAARIAALTLSYRWLYAPKHFHLWNEAAEKWVRCRGARIPHGAKWSICAPGATGYLVVRYRRAEVFSVDF